MCEDEFAHIVIPARRKRIGDEACTAK
jgi:hypothetical protein